MAILCIPGRLATTKEELGVAGLKEKCNHVGHDD